MEQDDGTVTTISHSDLSDISQGLGPVVEYNQEHKISDSENDDKSEGHLPLQAHAEGLCAKAEAGTYTQLQRRKAEEEGLAIAKRRKRIREELPA
jgi:hypothetical protein